MATFFDNYFNLGRILREKRAYRQMMARVNALPEDYRYVFKRIQRHMWMFASGAGFDMHLQCASNTQKRTFHLLIQIIQIRKSL